MKKEMQTHTHMHTELTNISSQEDRTLLLARWLHRAQGEVPNSPEEKQTLNRDTVMSKANGSSSIFWPCHGPFTLGAMLPSRKNLHRQVYAFF